MNRFSLRNFTRLWLVVFILWTLGLVTPGGWFGQAASTKVGELSAGKILHVGVYALLAGSAGWLPIKWQWRFLIAVPLLSAHGALTETIQLWIPQRTGSAFDWMIDTTGIILGWLAARTYWPSDSDIAAR